MHKMTGPARAWGGIVCGCAFAGIAKRDHGCQRSGRRSFNDVFAATCAYRVTVILPHGGNLFREKVPGPCLATRLESAGSTQVNELGEIETPIMLTSTLSVPRTADAVIDYMLALPGNEDVQSINPLVGETNDGYLNDIRGRHVSRDDVFAAIKSARSGPVEEGAVGAGTGTVAFGWKGGIGTASRKLPQNLGGYTVGVLVQSNYGGILTIKRRAGRSGAGEVLSER